MVTLCTSQGLPTKNVTIVLFLTVWTILLTSFSRVYSATDADANEHRLFGTLYGHPPHLLTCQSPDSSNIQDRYGYLRSRKYNIMIGGNTHNTEFLLPTQIKAFTALMDFLPESSFGFSVHESGSTDRTGRVLTEILIPLLQFRKVKSSEIFITTTKEGPKWNADPDKRIPLLVDLRNLVIYTLSVEGSRSNE